MLVPSRRQVEGFHSSQGKSGLLFALHTAQTLFSLAVWSVSQMEMHPIVEYGVLSTMLFISLSLCFALQPELRDPLSLFYAKGRIINSTPVYL